MVPLGYSPQPPSALSGPLSARLDSTQDASPLIRNVLRRKEQVLIPEIDRLIDLRQLQAVASEIESPQSLIGDGRLSPSTRRYAEQRMRLGTNVQQHSDSQAGHPLGSPSFLSSAGGPTRDGDSLDLQRHPGCHDPGGVRANGGGGCPRGQRCRGCGGSWWRGCPARQ